MCIEIMIDLSDIIRRGKKKEINIFSSMDIKMLTASHGVGSR